jgi:hypothetical protein
LQRVCGLPGPEPKHVLADAEPYVADRALRREDRRVGREREPGELGEATACAACPEPERSDVVESVAERLAELLDALPPAAHRAHASPPALDGCDCFGLALSKRGLDGDLFAHCAAVEGDGEFGGGNAANTWKVVVDYIVRTTGL